MKDKNIIKKGQDIGAHILVGKKGLDENMLAEIERRLEDEKMLKIKILRNAPVTDMKEIVASLNEKVKGRIVEVRGRTLLLSEK